MALPSAGSAPKTTGLKYDATHDILYVAQRTGGWQAVESAAGTALGSLAFFSTLGELTSGTASYEVHRADVAIDPNGDGKGYLFLPNFNGPVIFDVTNTSAPAKVITLATVSYGQNWWDCLFHDTPIKQTRPAYRRLATGPMTARI